MGDKLVYAAFALVLIITVIAAILIILPEEKSTSQVPIPQNKEYNIDTYIAGFNEKTRTTISPYDSDYTESIHKRFKKIEKAKKTSNIGAVIKIDLHLK